MMSKYFRAVVFQLYQSFCNIYNKRVIFHLNSIALWRLSSDCENLFVILSKFLFKNLKILKQQNHSQISTRESTVRWGSFEWTQLVIDSYVSWIITKPIPHCRPVLLLCPSANMSIMKSFKSMLFRELRWKFNFLLALKLQHKCNM